MTRNLKAFGLALMAAMAIGVIGAQAASAATEHSFRSGAAETVLTGQTESYGNAEHKSIEVFRFTAGLTIECYATYEGKQIGTTLDEVTVHQKYSTCTPNGTVVETDGCNYRFDSDTDVSSGHFSAQEHAQRTFECEGSTHPGIEYTRPGCTTFIPPQTVRGIRYTQLANHSGKHALTVTATLRTIDYTVTSGSFCGLAGHGAGTYTNGITDTKFEVTGFVAGASPSGSTTAGTTWTHGAQVDLTLSTPT
jgi:hypothetical protein